MKKEEDEVKPTIFYSLIATSPQELLAMIEKARPNTNTFQLDIMDGKFVANTSLTFPLNIPADLEYEAHLMVVDPVNWINRMPECVHTIIFHLESEDPVESVISRIRAKGKRVGIAINPQTPVDKIAHFIPMIDQVLVMTVIPGQYGAPFLPENLKKIAEIHSIRPDIDIEVDGGISQETIAQAGQAGANLFVVGSALKNAPDMKLALDMLNSHL